MREDYGAFWDGKITIRDTTVYNTGSVTVVSGTWYHHDFGYRTMHPTEIEIDGLKLKTPASIHLFSSALIQQTNTILQEKFTVELKDEDGNPTGEFVEIDNLNPTAPTERIIIKNNTEAYDFIFPDAVEYPFFKDMEIIIS